MTFLLIFIFGLIIGSFLNAVIHRLHTGESIFEKSSRCVHCGHKLSPLDLIPLVSFFILRRKCRYCKQPISWQYPLVEIATAVAFVLIYSQNPPFPSLIKEGSGGEFFVSGWVELLFQFIFTAFLIVIFVYDLKHYLILDKVVFPAAGLALLYQLWQGNLLNALLGAVLLGGFFGLLYLVSRGRWIGLGDVKLGIFLGFLIPWPTTLVLFFFAYLVGALISLFLLALGFKTLKDRLPFGTFLTLAAFLAMLKGEEIIQWYFRLIGVSL